MKHRLVVQRVSKSLFDSLYNKKLVFSGLTTPNHRQGANLFDVPLCSCLVLYFSRKTVAVDHRHAPLIRLPQLGLGQNPPERVQKLDRAIGEVHHKVRYSPSQFWPRHGGYWGWIPRSCRNECSFLLLRLRFANFWKGFREWILPHPTGGGPDEISTVLLERSYEVLNLGVAGEILMRMYTLPATVPCCFLYFATTTCSSQGSNRSRVHHTLSSPPEGRRDRLRQTRPQ